MSERTKHLGDLLTSGLDAAAPPLPDELAERVQRLARAELAPIPEAPSPGWGLQLREALVPALLMSATLIRTADSAAIARRVFASSEQVGESAADDDRGRR